MNESHFTISSTSDDGKLKFSNRNAVNEVHRRANGNEDTMHEVALLLASVAEIASKEVCRRGSNVITDDVATNNNSISMPDANLYSSTSAVGGIEQDREKREQIEETKQPNDTFIAGYSPRNGGTITIAPRISMQCSHNEKTKLPITGPSIVSNYRVRAVSITSPVLLPKGAPLPCPPNLQAHDKETSQESHETSTPSSPSNSAPHRPRSITNSSTNDIYRQPFQPIKPTTIVQKLQLQPKRNTGNSPFKTILRKKFSWKNYPKLEAFLIANREEYLRHSTLNYTIQQKQYNNRLTERMIQLAAEQGFVFDQHFSFVTLRDRIRCYYKSYVQSLKKRGVVVGYAARKAGLVTEGDLEASAAVAGKIFWPAATTAPSSN